MPVAPTTAILIDVCHDNCLVRTNMFVLLGGCDSYKDFLLCGNVK